MVHHRSLFISDIHLGAKGSKAEELLMFLEENACDTLYLVGDCLDFWKIKRYCYFPASHVKVIQSILEKADSGTNVFYIAGNHDDVFRKYLPSKFGNIKLLNEIIHVTADGKRLLVIHGDQFDGIVMSNAKWLCKIGDIAYEHMMTLNNILHYFRAKFGYEYWSLSAHMKSKVKSIVQFVARFEEIVTASVISKGVDGIVLGHIHSPNLTTINGFVYANCGDWMESKTAISEDYDGNLKLIRYS